MILPCNAFTLSYISTAVSAQRAEVAHPGFGSQPKLPCWSLQKHKVVSPPLSSFYWGLHCAVSRRSLCSTELQLLQALHKMCLMFVLFCCSSVLSNFPSEKNQKMRVSVLTEHSSFLSLTFYFAHLFAWEHESLPFIWCHQTVMIQLWKAGFTVSQMKHTSACKFVKQRACPCGFWNKICWYVLKTTVGVPV